MRNVVIARIMQFLTIHIDDEDPSLADADRPMTEKCVDVNVLT